MSAWRFLAIISSGCAIRPMVAGCCTGGACEPVKHMRTIPACKWVLHTALQRRAEPLKSRNLEHELRMLDIRLGKNHVILLCLSRKWLAEDSQSYLDSSPKQMQRQRLRSSRKLPQPRKSKREQKRADQGDGFAHGSKPHTLSRVASNLVLR